MSGCDLQIRILSKSVNVTITTECQCSKNSQHSINYSSAVRMTFIVPAAKHSYLPQYILHMLNTHIHYSVSQKKNEPNLRAVVSSNMIHVQNIWHTQSAQFWTWCPCAFTFTYLICAKMQRWKWCNLYVLAHFVCKQWLHSALIKTVYEQKGYNAGKFMSKFPQAGRRVGCYKLTRYGTVDSSGRQYRARWHHSIAGAQWTRHIKYVWAQFLEVFWRCTAKLNFISAPWRYRSPKLARFWKAVYCKIPNWFPTQQTGTTMWPKYDWK